MEEDYDDLPGWHTDRARHGRQGHSDRGVERSLAQFAFIREERDREVRLLFRSVSPVEIALAFRAAGARLISIAGERATPGATGEPQELTLRYFFALGETVYTVSIASPEGFARTVADIYPAARAIEDELSARLGVAVSR
jgi:hypothetical protein